MQKFVGEAFLLNVNVYEKKEDNEKEGKVFYRYEFLVGDQEDGSTGFISNAHVEGYTADHEVINGGGSFMEVIKVSVQLREFFVKGQGKVKIPVYEVLPQ